MMPVFAKGLTLIELLISLSILAVLFCFAYPLTPSLYGKNQLQVVCADIKNAVLFAKLQAQLRGERLILAPVSETCNWALGMRLFVDNPKHRYTSEDSLLREWHWHTNGLQIRWRGFFSTDYLLFAQDMNHNAVNGSFLIQNSVQRITLFVNRLGRIRSEISLCQ